MSKRNALVLLAAFFSLACSASPEKLPLVFQPGAERPHTHHVLPAAFSVASAGILAHQYTARFPKSPQIVRFGFLLTGISFGAWQLKSRNQSNDC